jgi:ketosteroid isomerase-like protein
MYTWIVRSKLESAFAAINRGDYAPVIAAFNPEHEHVFYGEHALGGARKNLETTKRWYERLQKVFPDLRFEIKSIAVNGWPWKTHAVATWTDTFTLPNGERGSNQGVHTFELAWGRVKRLEIYCDTERLKNYCARIAESGVSEAALPPLVD